MFAFFAHPSRGLARCGTALATARCVGQGCTAAARPAHLVSSGFYSCMLCNARFMASASSSSQSSSSRAGGAGPRQGPPTAMSTGPVNFYKRLQVSVEATAEEIKTAYRARALECHPDVVDAANKAYAEVAFRGISEAYETLSDPRKRRMHDESLGLKRSAPQPSSAAAASADASEGMGQRQSARKRRSAGYTGYQAPSSSRAAEGEGFSSASAKAWKKPYVRGDADRAFAAAFEGKSLDQILFEARRRKRMEAAAAAAKAAVRAQQTQQRQQQQQGDPSGEAATAGNPSASTTGSMGHQEEVRPRDEQAAGHAASVRRAMEHAAERYADKMQRQFGPGVLRSVRAGSLAHVGSGRGGGFHLPGGPLPTGPQPPPSDRLPFQPFPGQPLPEGVTAPVVPVTQAVGNASDDSLEAATEEEVFAQAEREFLLRHPQYAPGGKDEAVYSAEREDLRQGFQRHPNYFHEHRLKDGTRLSPLESLNRAERHIAGAAHNMGQLYSYQRPY